MESNLSEKEIEFIKQLLKKVENKEDRTLLVKLVPFVNTILGIIFIVATALYFLNNPTDYTAKWVVLPGFISGLILIVTGLLLSKENARTKERRKMAFILKKLVSEDFLNKVTNIKKD